jgi:hypothetical protein
MHHPPRNRTERDEVPSSAGANDGPRMRFIRSSAARVGLYSDTAIAAAVGVTPLTVSRWYAGAQPRPEQLVSLAEVLRLDLGVLTRYFVEDGPEPTSEPSAPDEGDPAAVRAALEQAEQWGPPLSSVTPPPARRTPARR